MEFKGANGSYLTQGLFYEFNNPDAVYTLRPEDHKSKKGKTYKSVYKIYMESVDEYDAAINILGSYVHWQKLCQLDWFMKGFDFGAYRLPGLEDWRQHLKARDESTAKRQLLQEAENGSVTAQKTIYDSSKGKPQVKKKNAVKSDTGASRVSSLADRLQGIKNG